MKTNFHPVLDGQKDTPSKPHEESNSPHLVESLERRDPFPGTSLCGFTSEAFTSFGSPISEPDPEVCEECTKEAKKRWKAITKA